jgi:phage tail-like protein
MSENQPDSAETPDEQEISFLGSYGWLSLRRKSGPATRRTIDQAVYRIGREIGVELVLPDPVISRNHAQILGSPEGCQIEDLGSANKTFLNDEELPPHEPRPLIEGDVIKLGDYTLTYHLPEPIVAEEEEFVLTFAEAPPPPSIPTVPLAWPLPPRSSYLNYLPSFFSKDSLMDRFLLIFESILAPLEQLVDHIPLLLDPRTMPADLLPWVASWLDLTLNEKWPEAHRRDLIRSASELYRWRGTHQGLCRYLEIYAGVCPELDDMLDKAHTFRVTLRVPADQTVDEELVRAIIDAEKPAHTHYELIIEGQPDENE